MSAPIIATIVNRGPAGPSNYQRAVAVNGFTGTEAEYLASLSGSAATPSALRIVDGVVSLELSDGTTLQDNLPASGGEEYDDAPLVARIEQVEAALEDIPGEYNDAPLVERVEALESAAPVTLSALVIREDRLIAIMSDGSEVLGPVIVGAAPAPLVAPAFGPGGSLTIEDETPDAFAIAIADTADGFTIQA